MHLPFNFHAACERENVAAEELLALGAAGDRNFEFLVAVPKVAVVKLSREDRAGLEGETALLRAPNVLVLHTHHCQELLARGRTEIEAVARGYTQYGKGTLRPSAPPQNADWRLPVHTSYPADHPFRKWTHWVIRAGPRSKKPIEITIRDVLVTSRTFEELLRARFRNAPAGYTWISANLPLAWNAAQRFWGDPKVILSDKDTHPNPRDMKAWLVQMGASESAAERIVQIIRPESAAPPGRPQK